MEEALGLVIGGRMQQQVDRSHTGLLAVGHKHDHRLVGRVVLDGLVHRPAHCQQPRGPVVDVETLDHHLQRHSPHVRREVEETGAAGSDPLAHVLGVGQRGRQGNDADGLLYLHGDVPHAAHHGLQGRPHITVQQVQLVNHEKAHLLHALPRLPAAAHQVPLLGRRDDDVRLLKDLHVAGGLTHELRDLEAQGLAKLVGPLVEALLGR
mmetsp:Transcript_49716/g.133064  ORF Transcript_49716/g.133064 Transcript_49716/m.133064 type:complete len:208 (+) Transcript_49716:1792-2415(+)